MAKRYVRLLLDCRYTGRVFPVRRVNKRDWVDWIRLRPATVVMEGFPRKRDIGVCFITDVEFISEKEYFTEKLRGN